MRRSEIVEGGHYAVVVAWQGSPAASRPVQEYVVVDVGRNPSAPTSVRARRMIMPFGGLDEPTWLDLRAIVAPWDVWQRRQADDASEARRLRLEVVEARRPISEALEAVGVADPRLYEFTRGMSEYVALTEAELRALGVGSTP